MRRLATVVLLLAVLLTIAIAPAAAEPVGVIQWGLLYTYPSGNPAAYGWLYTWCQGAGGVYYPVASDRADSLGRYVAIIPVAYGNKSCFSIGYTSDKYYAGSASFWSTPPTVRVDIEIWTY